MARGDNLLIIVQARDLTFTHWVDYKGAMRLLSTLPMIDNVSLLLDAHTVLVDELHLTDSVYFFRPELRFTDTLVLSDNGLLSRYDYASLDYFETPADYVGEHRVF